MSKQTSAFDYFLAPKDQDARRRIYDDSSTIPNRIVASKDVADSLAEELKNKFGNPPAPLATRPKKGEVYYITSLDNHHVAIECTWQDSYDDEIRFMYGNCFATKDDAAIMHGMALLSFKYNQAAHNAV